MNYLNQDQIEAINGNVLCWLATTSESGQPNVSPKEMFLCLDSKTIIIANISSPGSVKNIQTNPKVCFSSIDVFRQKGYKIYGEATILGNDGNKSFEEFRKILIIRYGNSFPILSIIQINISSVSKILAPSYLFNLGKTEEEMINEAKRTYKVH